jgi:long-chain acyl-CoA synthetase
LPLAHIFERTAGFWVPIRTGCAIAYSESLRTIDKNLREARPTIMFAVPRFFEMLADKIQAGSEVPEEKRAKYLQALDLARKAGRKKGGVAGASTLGLLEKIQLPIFEKLVYSKVRDKFGGRLKAFVSGGAPLAPEIAALFVGLNITLLEGYGLTETSPVIAVNLPGAVRIGTVGEILQNVECKIADDGEICVRGDSITRGYWGREEATREAINADGLVPHRRHRAHHEREGAQVLADTDRKKDLLVLANGKKVAPAPDRAAPGDFADDLASRLARRQAEGRLGPHRAADGSAAIIRGQAESRAEYGRGDSRLASDLEARARGDRRSIEDLADFEKIKKFSLIDKAFSIEGGELTPTLKVKRRVVAEKYGSLVLTD